MKLAMAFSVVFSFLMPMFSYTAMPPVVDQDAFQSDIAIPLWLHIPSRRYITSIENSGNPGDEASRGAVVLALPGNGDIELQALEASFTAMGYQFESQPSYVASSGMVIATDSSTGRRVVIERNQIDDGVILRVSYDDPKILG